MNKSRSIKKKQSIDFSFYFPYLVQFATIPIQKIYKQQKKQKRLRYHSVKKIVQSQKNEKKVLLTNNFTKNKQHKQTKQIKKSTSLNTTKINFIETFPSEIRIKNNYQHTSLQKYKSIKSISQFSNSNTPIRYKTIENSGGQTCQQSNLIDKRSRQDTSLNFTQIPGITFKTSDKIQINRENPINSHHIRKGRETKWDKQRMANVEFIINRKCKDFKDIMAQYYQRSHQKANLIFIFDSHDGWIKRVLLKRGWTENKNKQSKAFHLLWTYKLPVQSLYPEQMVNHFPNSHKLTTKLGLYNVLKKYGLSFIQPKTYDLNHQKQLIVDHYSRLAFLNFLIQFLNNLQYKEIKGKIDANQLCQSIKQLLTESCSDEKELQFERELKCILQLSLNLLENTNYKFEKSNYNLIQLIKRKNQLMPLHHQMIKSLIKVVKLLSTAQQFAGCFDQSKANMWIIKSYCSSKGAGISLSNNIYTIIKQSNRLIQKYIQNPLLLKGFNDRKFDIRLWVLVKGNSKQCQVYFNEQFYGRLCFQPYCLKSDLIKESSIHFSNYSINKSNYLFDRKVSSILFSDQLFQEVQLCKGVNYRQIFYKKVEALLLSLVPIFKNQLCSKNSNNLFQLLGFDLLIDDQLNLHLLEINLSPQSQERHQKLTKILQSMGQGIINILQGKGELKQWRMIS